MKIVLILSSNTHWAPYYRRYVQELSAISQNFDFILWNREGIKEKIESEFCHLIEYSNPDKTNNNSPFKIFKFFKFASFIKKKLKETNYDKVVFLGTYAFVPAILSGFLKQNYKNKYWIDLRDLTYERFLIYKMMEKKAILNSYKTTISSKGFLPYIPTYDYCFIHNIDSYIQLFKKEYKKTTSSKIRICYIGNISYYESCFELIEKLANDERFRISFIGPNYEKLKTFCDKKGIYNVEFGGPFERKDTVIYYNETDIIFNNYGNKSLNVRTASSNKLYYSLAFHLPILVSKDTYMEQLCSAFNISFSFSKCNTFADDLYDWYTSFETNNPGFEKLWKEVSYEDSQSLDVLRKFMVENNE